MHLFKLLSLSPTVSIYHTFTTDFYSCKCGILIIIISTETEPEAESSEVEGDDKPQFTIDESDAKN